MSELKQSSQLNPFVVGGALSDECGYGFFGREDVFAFVRNALDVVKRNPILLFGQRRIGKSSILRQIPHRLSGNFIFVYFDLQGKATMELDQVLYGLGRAIMENMELPNPKREDTTEETFRRVFLPRVFEKLGDPRRLVLLLDEFDVIDETVAGPSIAAKSFVPYIGQHLTALGQIGLIFVVGRKMEEMSLSCTSSFLKDAVQKRIGRLQNEDVIRLLDKLSAGSIEFTKAAADRVYELTTGHPFCTQVLCHTLWNQYALRVSPVTADEVTINVPAAVELGTLGMNWIYDGLVTPEQRLFLSALSEAADPISGERVLLQNIQKVLRDKRLSVGSAELDRAAQDLSLWEVIVGNSKEGYRFAVPIIGVWIHIQRPLELLERETRFVNRRAWNFYELAIDLQKRGELEAAIDDYKNALNANPVFLEAQRGLAAALQKSNKPGRLPAAIEAWERVLELDDNSPRSDLLDLLLRALELSTSPSTISSYFRRITELDQDGLVRDRAYRNLKERAHKNMEIGSRMSIRKAILFYDLVGDAEGKAYAQTIARKQGRLEDIGFGLGLVSLMLAVGLGYVPWSELFPSSFGLEHWLVLLAWIRITFAGLFGMLFSWPSVMEKEATVTLRRSGLLFLAFGVAAGAAILNYTQSIGWAGFVAFFISTANGINAPSFPKEEREHPDLLTTNDFMYKILDKIIFKLISVQEFLRRPSPKRNKEK